MKTNFELEPGMDLYLDLLKKVLTASAYDESAWSIIETSKAKPRRPWLLVGTLMRDWFVRMGRKKSVVLVEVKPYDAERREIGKDWPMFGYTMVGLRRLDNVQARVVDVLKNGVPGDFIETGAWRGGTTMFMRALLKAYDVTDRTVWVADSFEGLPTPKSASDGWDVSQVDFLKVSLEKVQANFARFGLLDNQVKFLKGWFCDTLPKAPINKLAILRLDGDLYTSTMDSLQNLYHKVSPGGFVIVDDYYSWPGCHQAVTEFRAKNSIKAEIIPIDKDSMYWQCP